MIGKKVLSYEIVSLLGEGGMGNVYLAVHAQLGRKVAIKSLLPQLVRHEQIRERFKQEANTMARLQHPNIVSLIDYVEDGEGAYLIMEYVEGKELDAYIRTESGPMPKDRIMAAMTQILEAFAYAHDNGVIHRDIKPSNILFAKDGTIKIMDFGIAKLLSEADKKLTKTGLQMGTVYFMSPEQVKGKPVDKRADIYALGVTLFQMVTGHSPYESLTTEYEVYNRIVNDPLPPVASMYPGAFTGFDSIIAKATAKDPDDRFPDCRSFLKALHEPLTATVIDQPVYKEQGLLPPDPPPVKSSKKMIWILGAAAVVLTVFIWQYSLYARYKNLVSDADDRYAYGDYEEAVRLYNKASAQRKKVFWLSGADPNSSRVNDAYYGYYKDLGDKRLRSDSFSMAAFPQPLASVRDAYKEAQRYHFFDEYAEKRITLCDKIDDAIAKYKNEAFTDAESAYTDAITYARSISTDDSVIAHLRKAKTAVTAPKSKFVKIWMEHGVYQDGVYGMKIHIHFETAFLDYKSCDMVVWFSTASGASLQDRNGLYRASDNQVSVGKSFTPTYRMSTYEDFPVFMPYDEMEITTTGDYKFRAGIFYGQQQIGETSDYTTFTYTVSASDSLKK